MALPGPLPSWLDLALISFSPKCPAIGITELCAWCLRKGYMPDDAEVKVLKSDHAAAERRWRETLESVASPAVRAAWRAIQARRENLAKAVGALAADGAGNPG